MDLGVLRANIYGVELSARMCQPKKTNAVKWPFGAGLHVTDITGTIIICEKIWMEK